MALSAITAHFQVFIILSLGKRMETTERKAAPEERKISASAFPRPCPCFRQQPQLNAEAGIKKFLYS